MFDNDNYPTPENVPTLGAAESAAGGQYNGQEWGWDSINQQSADAPSKKQLSFKDEWLPWEKPNLKKILLHMLSINWVNGLILVETSWAMMKVV